MLHGVSHKCELTHPDLCVTRTQAGYEPRSLYRITGLSPQSDLGVNNSDIDTLETAMLTRMFYCKVGDEYLAPPIPNKQHLIKTLRAFRDRLVKRFHATRRSYKQVVEKYTGRKRTIYQNALESLQRNGLKRKHANSVVFVKVEKVNTTKAPRVIQPRKAEYNLELATYLKHIEHAIFKRIDAIFGDPTVMKGYNVKEVAMHLKTKWDDFEDPVAVGLDAVKFDMHVSAPMLHWEHSIYLAIYRYCKILRKLLQWQMHNQGSGYTKNGKLHYKVKGRRFSGDMNTGLGNCLIMCAMVWTFAMQRGIKVRLANNGDDCVVIMERRDLQKLTQGLDEWFLNMGFRMTCEHPVYTFEQIEFCQMHPVWNGTEYVMVRNIKTALQKDTMSVLNLSNEIMVRKWFDAIGECGLALTAGVPVLQSFYEAYLREGIPAGKLVATPQLATGMRMMRGDLQSKSQPITPESRYSVYLAWGLTPDQQEALERHYEEWTYEHTQVDIYHVPTVLHVF